MIRSLRFQLAARFTATMAASLIAVGVLSYGAVRASLDRQIDATLINIASFQAALVTEARSGEMRFHEWELTPAEARSILDLNRYAQVWTADGRSLLRTRFITSDLPLDRDALRAAAAGRLVWAAQTFQGVPVRSLYYPLGRLGPAHAHHVLQVAAPLQARNVTLRDVVLLLIGSGLIVILGTFTGSWWLAREAVRPVSEIIDQAESIEAGPGPHEIRAWAGTREYERLVQVLNTMLARLDAAFEGQRRFTADASHELRSPLTALQGELEVALRRERSPDEYRASLASALEETRRLSRTAEDLLTLARSDAGVLRPRLRRADLYPLVKAAADRLRPAAEAKGIHLRLEDDGAPSAWVDPELVGLLARNLIENAIRYTPRDGRVSVTLGHADRAAELSVADTGPGIPPGDRERVFERFYRGDDSRTPTRDTAGTGLGLALVRAIADAHGASLTVGAAAEGGADFRVSFPAESAEVGHSPVSGTISGAETSQPRPS